MDGQGSSGSGKGTAAQGGPPEDFEAVSRRSRTQLALVACVGLVIMAGAAMSVYDQFLGPPVDPDDVGAPAVTGATYSELRHRLYRTRSPACSPLPATRH